MTIMKSHYRSGFRHCFFWILIGIGAGTLATMLLWNWLLPPLFGLKEISFLQGAGLLILGRLLFGGMHGRHGYCHNHTNEQYEQLTPEARERLKARIKERWCCWSSKSTENKAN
jgi:hypothetical protein